MTNSGTLLENRLQGSIRVLCVVNVLFAGPEY